MGPQRVMLPIDNDVMPTYLAAFCMVTRHIPKLSPSSLYNMCRSALTLCMILFLTSCFELSHPAGGSQAEFKAPRIAHSADVAVPAGYRLEIVATGLTFPTGVTFDQTGRPYVVEAGYSYGEVWATPRLLRIEEDGTSRVVLEGQNNGPWTGVTFHDGQFFIAEGGTLRGGRILQVTPDHRIIPLLENLPSIGDHHTNGPVVGPDGLLYFSIGTTTNSGVVGEDNARFGWLGRYPHGHDVPCKDLTLTGENFKTGNPMTPEESDTAVTGAFSSFGQTTSAQQVIKGQVPCSGAILKMPLAGGRPDLVAWGLRNPFGLAFHPDGTVRHG